MPTSLTVNGTKHTVSAPGDTPLLWVLRDDLALTGTKFGCGIGQCGACTVHLDGQPTRSCQLPLSAVGTHRITTIEGLATAKGLTAVQSAWIAEDVRSAATARPGRSSRPRRCSRARRIPATPR